MFKITLSPQFSLQTLSLEKRGKSLIINGDELDFSELVEGGEYRPEAIDNNAVVGSVSKQDGYINITVILPYNNEHPAIDVMHMHDIIAKFDGVISLPEGRELEMVLELPEPEPTEEGGNNAD